MSIWAKAMALWPVLLALIVAVGAVRELLVADHLGPLAAHQVMTLAACAVVFGAIVMFVRVVRPSPTQALGMGALWVILGVLFEFGFFHYVGGHPWSELLADYDLSRGRLLLLLWATLLLGPWLAARRLSLTK